MSDDTKDVQQQNHREAPEVSRRSFIRRSLIGAVTLGSGALAAGAATAAQGKVTKAVAHYQNHPNGAKHCGVCVHYRFPFGCQLVEGLVSPHGVCQFFMPRA
jgi:hypothetical protein